VNEILNPHLPYLQAVEEEMHPGRSETYTILSRHLFRPNLSTDTRHHVQNRDTCGRIKPLRSLWSLLVAKHHYRRLASMSETVTLVAASSHRGPACTGCCFACLPSILHDAWLLPPCPFSLHPGRIRSSHASMSGTEILVAASRHGSPSCHFFWPNISTDAR
jgi:hypothetical protein